MIHYLLLIDKNGFEKQVIHDSLPPTYKVALARKLVSYDWTGKTTLAQMLEGEVGFKEQGYEVLEVSFVFEDVRDYYGRHVYREVMK